MASDFAHQLNPDQLRAVTAPDGPVLVIAAAGTGKTQTLTHRVAWLVQEQSVDPRNILLLTFTNRAAQDMLERATRLVGGGLNRLWSGTFHHSANRLLRRHAAQLGYGNDYTILDEDDSLRLLRNCVAELGLKDKKFPKPKVLSSVFGLAANRGADVVETVQAHFGAHTVDVESVLQVHQLYAERKRGQNAMDFDDLLVNGLRLLQEHPRVAATYQERMRHVLVDEYQDTNVLQSAFADEMARRHGNLFVVGDDFQSIYSWRGADVDNILSFAKRHPGATTFKLEENYRSTPGILEVANQVIAGATGLFSKTLRATRPAEVPPILARLSDGGHQARYVVERIQRLLDAGTAQPREIAILYRSHYQALEMQLELSRTQLHYVVVSGVRFFEQAHIKDVCTVPRLAANPVDQLAFSRLVELLPRVGPKKAQSLWKALGEHLNLRDAAKRAKLLELLPKEAQTLWQAIMDRLFTAEDSASAVLERPDELVFRFTKAFYEDFAENTFENARSRLEDIEELVRFSAKYKNTAEFLGEMALLTNLDAQQDARAVAPADAIRLTTVHQAKGLEWKAVFVIWLADGMFPAARSLEEPASESEERRLFYVAVTRAKDYLWLCVPRMRKSRDGGIQFCAPSRFVDEIPSDLVQSEQPGGFSNTPRWARW